ncbi:DMT family transporter [Salmonella enterica subsp. enterica serovar Enteritidis]|nr:DMT family transporter [Salmonella enterica subsp. enterica serovar Enteritidis]
MQLNLNQRGAVFMVVSQAAFMANDTLVKLATGNLGIAQIMFVRGIFASALVALLVWRTRQFRPLSTLTRPAVALRILGEIGGTLTYLIALANMPIANVQAVFQALPLAITMTAALFLGEQVGYRRWSAIALGFVGVLIIVRPGMEGFNAYVLWVLASVAFCTVRDLATRRIPQDVPSGFVSMLTAMAIMLCGGVMLAGGAEWRPLTPVLLATLAGAALMVLTGYQFIILSMRSGDISFVAPFRYTALIWAILSGIFVFGNMPDMPMLVGAAIVVASGIYSLYRERVAGRSKPIAESTVRPVASDGL